MAYRHILALARVVMGLAISFPEVVPGPGPPSLSELGLTWADIFTMAPPVRK
jgi:hypothetical protein